MADCLVCHGAVDSHPRYGDPVCEDCARAEMQRRAGEVETARSLRPSHAIQASVTDRRVVTIALGREDLDGIIAALEAGREFHIHAGDQRVEIVRRSAWWPGSAPNGR